MKPVLVDTSVWRRHFGGAQNVRALGEMLDEQDAVLVHPFVLGEMVLGGLSLQPERPRREKDVCYRRNDSRREAPERGIRYFSGSRAMRQCAFWSSDSPA